MTNSPELSVIVPVYNVEKVIEGCLESIQAQTYQDYEIILIDDGSIDNSGVICDKYAEDDERYKVIHIENSGVSNARNLGLDMARGKYAMFVDSDDSILTDMFERFVSEIRTNMVDVVIGGLIQYENGNYACTKLPQIIGRYDNSIWEIICRHSEMFGYIAGKIYRLDIIKKNNIKLNTSMYSQEDLDFNLSVYEKCKTFKTIDYSGYIYNHVSGKRVPPIWDFIANTLKINRIGNEKILLSDSAKESICHKISTLMFSYLYNIRTKSEHDVAIEKLQNVAGLELYFKGKQIKGEEGIIVRWYLKKHYNTIYYYFYIRKLVKRVLGKPISE